MLNFTICFFFSLCDIKLKNRHGNLWLSVIQCYIYKWNIYKYTSTLPLEWQLNQLDWRRFHPFKCHVTCKQFSIYIFTMWIDTCDIDGLEKQKNIEHKKKIGMNQFERCLVILKKKKPDMNFCMQLATRCLHRSGFQHI